MKGNEIIMRIHVCLNWQANINSKMVESEVFLMKLKLQYHLPNKENEFVVPNQ